MIVFKNMFLKTNWLRLVSLTSFFCVITATNRMANSVYPDESGDRTLPDQEKEKEKKKKKERKKRGQQDFSFTNLDKYFSCFSYTVL